MAPKFADEAARHAKHEANGHKLTDFNDLAALEGRHVVRAQVEERLSILQWQAPPAQVDQGGAGKGGRLRPIESVDELLQNFALVYAQGGMMFDAREHMLAACSDVRDRCLSPRIYRDFCEHPDRQIVRLEAVGFDPAGDDPKILCNLWGGWPTTPKSGGCESLLELLRYMCSGESNSEQLYQWVLFWLAYSRRLCNLWRLRGHAAR